MKGYIRYSDEGILYEMLVVNDPLTGENVISVLDSHIEDAFNPSDEADPHKAVALIAKEPTFLRRQ